MSREDMGDSPALAKAEPVSRLGPLGFDPGRSVEGEILRPESCDAEVADMMERLSRLQTWLTLQCCQRSGDPEFRSAMSLVQDVRVLIVERCFK